MHRVLSDQDLCGKRVFVYGDTHGCLNELRQLLRAANVLDTPIHEDAIDDPATFPPLAPDCVVISVGDVLNKGPLNLETLRFVRDMGILAVRGNHDERVQFEITKARDAPARQWQQQSLPDQPAEQVLHGRYQYLRTGTDADLQFLELLPYTISLPLLNSIVVHAGLLPDTPLDEQKPTDMTLMRNIISMGDGKMQGVEGISKGVRWASLWTGPQHVYFGHDARRGLQQEAFATGLDTGCVYGKTLTGVFLTGDKRTVQVRAAKEYAPKRG